MHGAWSEFLSMEITSEKFKMVTMPCRAPITTVEPWHANDRPRRSTGIQQSGSGRALCEVCQETQPVSSSHTNGSMRVCEA
jgi:hypothetical protein